MLRWPTLVTALSVLLLEACFKPGPLDASALERGKRHCTSGSECASGLCSNGRCN
jgi:hypothetical protein